MQNMNHMLKQAQKLQQEMLKAQGEMENKEFSFSAGGDMVQATVNGKKKLLRLEISPEVAKADDIEMLEDLLISAVNGAIEKADEAMSSGLKNLTKGLNLPPGLSL